MNSEGECNGGQSIKALAADSVACPATCRATIAQATGASESNINCAGCTTNCGRRLNEERGVPARQLATGTLSMPFVVSGGNAVSVTSTLNNLNAAQLQPMLQSALQSNGGSFANMTLTATNVVAQVAAAGRAGYTQCYNGQSCWFKPYAAGTHYKIYKATANYPKDDCAQACANDNTCEAFESLSNGVLPSCSFWMNGACDIMKGNPDGFVNTGVDYAYFCDKVGNRATYTPVASQSLKSCMFSSSLMVLSVFLVAGVLG